MIMFKTREILDKRIVKVEVDRANEKSVWIKGKRHTRHSSWHGFFDNAQEAKDSLLKECLQDVDRAHRQAEYARGELELVQKMDLNAIKFENE